MANTPSFNWETPDDTDYVTDGAAAIRTLGNSIDASMTDLKGGTTGQVLSKASGTDMDFTWVAQDDSNAIQNALLTTTGDTIYASGASTPARLGIGSTGQVLTVAGGVPTWATAAGGKLKQAVAATYSTQVNSSTTTPVSTGLSVSITPSATTSKVLIMANIDVGTTGAGSDGGQLWLYRGGSSIIKFGDRIGYNGSGVYSVIGPVGVHYLDSPSTTSSTTYTIYLASVSSQTFSSNYTLSSVTSSIVALEIGA